MDHPARHPRHRLPTPSRPSPTWLTRPPVVAAAAVTAVGVVTAAIAAWRPEMSRGDLTILLAYGAVVAVLAAILTANLARHRAALRASRARAVADALEREERLRLIVGSLHEGLVFQDRDLRIVEFNEAAAAILGLTDTAIGRRPDELGPWQPLRDDGSPMPMDQHPATVTLQTGRPTFDLVMGVATGTGTVWLRLNTVPVLDDEGTIDGVISTFQDITPERTARRALASSEEAVSVATEALSWQSLHDPLTGLPNRTQVIEQITATLEHSSRDGGVAALLLISLDRFKNVNEAMGHEAGDRLLVEVAERLRRAVRGDDVVARLGADEFTVLAAALPHREEALHLAERLRAAVARPLTLPQGTVTVSASVGIAFDLDHRPSTLLRDADTALRRAKELGRDRIEVFKDSLRVETIRRVTAEQLLRQALDENGLRVLYQPIVDLTTGEVIGAEALLRLLGPHNDLVAPASFIDIAEETGLIVPIGAGVLDDACRQLARWTDELGDLAPRSVSVNVSARQIATDAFPSLVARTLERHGVAPGSLTLELTETTLIEASRAAFGTVEALHELGVRLAIDDFGTGYSSLAYLKRFPIDVVKVDQSFVGGLGEDPHDTEIVRAVLALGQSLGLVTVAEGVETPEQLELLRSLGCDCAQGFLLAVPVASDELGTTIRRIRARQLSPPGERIDLGLLQPRRSRTD